MKILVAFDDSENAMRAVEHVARFFTPDSSIVLFSVLQDTANICDLQSPGLTPYFHSQQSTFCNLEEKKKYIIEDALKQATKTLEKAGFDRNSVTIKVQKKRQGIARDIVDEARNGYDIIVMGRRGMSGIKEFFAGSISQKVLHLANDMSILMVN